MCSSLPKFTSLFNAITVAAVEGSDHEYTATIPWDWAGPSGTHGGFIACLICSAAETFFKHKYPNLGHNDPVNTHFQFLAPVPKGEVVLKVHELSIKPRYSAVQVGVWKPSSADKILATAIVTMASLDQERGLTIACPPVIPAIEIPDRENVCEVASHPLIFTKAFPVMAKLESWRPKCDMPGQTNCRFGPNSREQWLKFADSNVRFTTISVLLICDFFLSGPTCYFETNMTGYQANAYPSIAFSVEIKKDPGHCEWLFTRIQTRAIQNGRFDEEVQIVDEAGHLIALSKHVNAIKTLDPGIKPCL